jgi:hypothetical protein
LFFDFAAVPPKTAGDKRQQARAKQKAAFALEAGFAKQTFNAAIRHASHRVKQTGKGISQLAVF